MGITTESTTIWKQEIAANMEENKTRYITISHDIHAHPEIGNQETYAAKTLTDILVETDLKWNWMWRVTQPPLLLKRKVQ